MHIIKSREGHKGDDLIPAPEYEDGMEMGTDLSPYQLLRLYIESGADEVIGDAAPDRFALPARPSIPTPAAVPRPVTPVAAAPPPPPAETIHGTSAHRAAACASLAELKSAMEAFDDLPVKAAALSTVFADGVPTASVMIIGEAPGFEEDRQGLPFVGKSGKLLDRMLASVGLSRAENVYITNVMPWRPLENRKPTPDEVTVCLPFLMRHIELVSPQVLLLVGGVSASALLAHQAPISAVRGQWHDISLPRLGRPLPAIATFHPAYLLRTPEAKRQAWSDLLQLRRKLDAFAKKSNALEH